MKKGTFLRTRSGNNIYEIIGRWDKDIVLMPTKETDDQVLIYGPGELDRLIEDGHFRILPEMPAKGGQK